jgi:ribonucleoside-diphosphate reductase alpha chain
MTKIDTLQVTKRDGSLEQFDVAQIRDAINFAMEGINLNPLKLETAFNQSIYDGIPTDKIQDSLIIAAVNLVSSQEPNWKYVAGRLITWSRQHRLSKLGLYYDDLTTLLEYVAIKSDDGTYSELLNRYSDEQLMEAFTWINPSYDHDYDVFGAEILEKRYLLKDEPLQLAYVLTALIIAIPEKSKEARMKFAFKLYHAIAQRKISLATPILANMRKAKGSISSCFIITMEDDLNSIYREITNAALISKNGGGVGCNVSRIRATGSQVMGNDNASGGVIPWIKLLNDTAIAVNQGGRRAGAITVSLDIWHLDILEFLEMQTENGDQRRKAYDVFPQVVLNDVFNGCVEADGVWYLVCPYEVKQHYGVDIASLWGDEFEAFYLQLCFDAASGKYQGRHKLINAKDLFKSIMQTCVETGLPYINRANPNKHEGMIAGSNLCCESFSNTGVIQLPNGEKQKVAHTCNLISINLYEVDTHSPELEEMCSIAVRALDNSIDVNDPSFEDSAIHNQRYRTIGVGAMGLADWMVKNNLKYSQISIKGSASRTLVDELFEKIAYHCTKESVKLAEERGAYPAFDGSEWSKGKLLGSKTIEEIQSRSINPSAWAVLKDLVARHGIRNSQITAIAPNTSSSLVQGCTASILPVFSRMFEEKWSKGKMFNSPPLIVENPLAYEENIHLDQNNIIELTRLLQFWIDTGISMELIFNPNKDSYFKDGKYYEANPKHVFDVLTNSFDEIKAVYYQRFISKGESEKSVCLSCAN